MRPPGGKKNGAAPDSLMFSINLNKIFPHFQNVHARCARHTSMTSTRSPFSAAAAARIATVDILPSQTAPLSKTNTQIQIFGYNSQLYSNFSDALNRAQGIVGVAVLLQVRKRETEDAGMSGFCARCEGLSGVGWDALCLYYTLYPCSLRAGDVSGDSASALLPHQFEFV